MKLAAVLALLLVLVSAPSSRCHAASHLATAPSFRLPTANGTVDGDSLRGKVVLIDFWASWCAPCRKSFPWLESMQQRYGSKGLVVVGINLDKSRDDAAGFLEKHPVTFTVAFDPAGKTAESFRVAGMPSSYLIAPDGKVLHASLGFDTKTAASIENLIQGACAP